MTEQPKPIPHMITWGMVSGFVLALLYAALLANVNTLMTLALIASPVSWLFAFGYGAFPGGVMGIIVGWILKQFTDDAATVQDLRSTRFSVYTLAFFLTLGISSALVAPLLTVFAASVLIFPPLIAASAATYAAHRYLFRRELYLRGQDSRKVKDSQKSKNDDKRLARLSDGVTLDEANNRLIVEAGTVVQEAEKTP